MSERGTSERAAKAQPQVLEPVHAGEEDGNGGWAARLVLFLRVMAVLSLVKGLYHWAAVCGLVGESFDAYVPSYQVATVYFAVLDLVAAVGLWLAAPWGAVVWLTAVISMVAVEMMFPNVFGGSLVVIVIEALLLGAYLWLALQAAREQPA